MTKILVLTACLIALSGVAAACDCGTNECRSPGYWKNHADSWPVQCIEIGGISYSKTAAIEIMQKPVKGDKTYTMFDALVAARLNVANNCHSCQIDNTIEDADQWMGAIPYFGPVGSGVKASSDAWQKRTEIEKCSIPSGEYLYKKLDAYNNGQL
ncbi:hypothetical protein [Methanosarcina sp. 1.H.A.2.2]|uniref:hypothetical protein n=1 Tax=Methanosarcina sp. 1.H.A.2.2 TaxID=1483601 RepID=UPI0006225FA8|nr:hypothetical protein [Methanosarcina sp. 1.H.A.2.2]KKH47169.1 hypothetical protein EO93_05965 [Methanosarcina sp. 1.H.A.2.2]